MVVVHAAPSRFTPQARKGQLVTVAEAAGDVARGREACALVTSTLHTAFYNHPTVSVTSGLRHTMQLANSALYQYNFAAPPHKRATVGVSAAVLQGSDLYLAQVPPTQAFIVHGGKLRGLPNPIGWIGGAQGGARWGMSGALGTSLGAEPEFFRAVVQPGDIVVLCSSNIARLLSRQQTEELLCNASAANVAEGLYALCRRANLPEAHALAIEVLPQLSAEAQQTPLSVAGVSERGKLAASAVGDWLGDIASEAQLAVQPKARPADPAPADEPALDTADDGADEPSMLDLVPVGDPEQLPLSAFLGEGDYGGIVRPPTPKRTRGIDLGDNNGTPLDFTALPRRTASPDQSLAERATQPVRSAIGGLLGGFRGQRRQRRVRRIRPAVAKAAPRMRGLSYRRQRQPFPWLQISLITLTFGLLVIAGLWANRRRDTTDAEQAITLVRQSLSAARAAPDDPAAQQFLREAEGHLKQIAPLLASGVITTTKPSWSSYQTVLQDYDQAMAAINHIGFLDQLSTIATLPDPATTISRLVLTTDPTTTTGALKTPLYLLDAANSTVFAQTGTTLRPILQPDTEIKGVQVGKIRELLWRDDNPMALERNPDPSNPFVLAYLRSGEDWVSTNLPGSEWLPDVQMPPMATFGGHLYIWNADATIHYGKPAQLMKYNAGRYADVPDEWINGSNPVKGNEVVSASIDGTVYLLHSDGSVSIFEANSFKRTLPAPSLAVPIATAQRFFVTPDVVDEATGAVRRAGHIFILDTQNERVVEIEKSDGRVVQQLQARQRGPLNQLTDLEVDEINGVIYLANGNRVICATLPAPAVLAAPQPELTTTPTP